MVVVVLLLRLVVWPELFQQPQRVETDLEKISLRTVGLSGGESTLLVSTNVLTISSPGSDVPGTRPFPKRTECRLPIGKVKELVGLAEQIKPDSLMYREPSDIVERIGPGEELLLYSKAIEEPQRILIKSEEKVLDKEAAQNQFILELSERMNCPPSLFRRVIRFFD